MRVQQARQESNTKETGVFNGFNTMLENILSPVLAADATPVLPRGGTPTPTSRPKLPPPQQQSKSAGNVSDQMHADFGKMFGMLTSTPAPVPVPAPVPAPAPAPVVQPPQQPNETVQTDFGKMFGNMLLPATVDQSQVKAMESRNDNDTKAKSYSDVINDFVSPINDFVNPMFNGSDPAKTNTRGNSVTMNNDQKSTTSSMRSNAGSRISSVPSLALASPLKSFSSVASTSQRSHQPPVGSVKIGNKTHKTDTPVPWMDSAASISDSASAITDMIKSFSFANSATREIPHQMSSLSKNSLIDGSNSRNSMGNSSNCTSVHVPSRTSRSSGVSANEWFESPAADALALRCVLAYGWSRDYAADVLHGYFQFLEVIKNMCDWDCKEVVPSAPVDLMWQQHILDVVNYVHDSTQICGRVLGREPSGHIDNLDDQTRFHKIRATKIALRARFGDNLNTNIWDFGPEYSDDVLFQQGGSRQGGLQTISESTKNPDSVLQNLNIATAGDDILAGGMDMDITNTTDTMAEFFCMGPSAQRSITRDSPTLPKNKHFDNVRRNDFRH